MCMYVNYILLFLGFDILFKIDSYSGVTISLTALHEQGLRSHMFRKHLENKLSFFNLHHSFDLLHRCVTVCSSYNSHPLRADTDDNLYSEEHQT